MAEETPLQHFYIVGHLIQHVNCHVLALSSVHLVEKLFSWQLPGLRNQLSKVHLRFVGSEV